MIFGAIGKGLGALGRFVKRGGVLDLIPGVGDVAEKVSPFIADAFLPGLGTGINIASQLDQEKDSSTFSPGLRGDFSTRAILKGLTEMEGRPAGPAKAALRALDRGDKSGFQRALEVLERVAPIGLGIAGLLGQRATRRSQERFQQGLLDVQQGQLARREQFLDSLKPLRQRAFEVLTRSLSAPPVFR